MSTVWTPRAPAGCLFVAAYVSLLSLCVCVIMGHSCSDVLRPFGECQVARKKKKKAACCGPASPCTSDVWTGVKLAASSWDM